ncbi:Uncharacterized protein PBTT_04442 [Plasmodiophora brassicae]
MTIKCATFVAAVLVSLSVATDFTCPQPSQIHCAASPTAIGNWKANGGQSAVTGFVPNAECANVIPLAGGLSRLFCCYTTCGVFYQDVPYTGCSKTSQSTFTCA